jgi:pyruvate kinase
MLVRLVTAGMNVARLNFSHGTHEYHRTVMQRIKRVRKALNKPVAILQDLQGPKIRVGIIKGGFVQLRPNQQFVLTSDRVEGNDSRACVSLRSMPEEVATGHAILLADGNIELRVERVDPPDIYCRVIVGGLLSSHKGVNLPASHVRVDAFTRKDRKDLEFGLKQGVDAIALSFIRTADEVETVKKVIARHGVHVPVVTKIEKHEAVENIDSIIAASNAIMVARGDLGVDIELERVPLVQKDIIRKCNAVGKPVITATQMLVRMVDNPRPTRAEATDVANAVLDGTDAVMLSEESAVGKYPAEAVMIMDRIVRAAETELDSKKFEGLSQIMSTRDAISHSSYFIAKEAPAAAIITPTWSGSTATLVARFRPKQPIIATSPNESALEFLAMSWGVIPLRIRSSDTIDGMIRASIKAALKAGLLERGQQVVVTGGAPLRQAGNTNFIKVERVE